VHQQDALVQVHQQVLAAAAHAQHLPPYQGIALGPQRPAQRLAQPHAR